MRCAALGVALLVACGAELSGEPSVPLPGAPDGGPIAGDDAGPARASDACADLFDHDRLPRFDLELDDEQLAAIEAEFRAPLAEFEANGAWPLEMPKTYFPLAELRHDGEVVRDAHVRLKGSTSWQSTLRHDGALAKMQFVVSFNQVDRDGRFHGQRKLEFDAPRHDPTLLRLRMGLEYLRGDLGVPAQCATSATVYLNGEYYGLFTLTERLDKEFLQRNFGDADEGDLYERGYILETNEDTADRTRRNELFKAKDMDDALAYADMAANIRVWAGEAMMPDKDGYYGGKHNFFLYDHPSRGFLWLPHDLDAVFDARPFDVDPVFWARDDQPGLHWLLVMGDPTWLGNYEAALCDGALAAYDVDRLQARVDAWSAQIAEAIDDDPRFRFTTAEWTDAIAALRDFIPARRELVAEWCACRQDGGRDGDDDGVPFCRDIDDDDDDLPAAVEACGDDLDDDGDGWVDEDCE